MPATGTQKFFSFRKLAQQIPGGNVRSNVDGADINGTVIQKVYEKVNERDDLRLDPPTSKQS